MNTITFGFMIHKAVKLSLELYMSHTQILRLTIAKIFSKECVFFIFFTIQSSSISQESSHSQESDYIDVIVW